MKKLTIDWFELELAFQDHADEFGTDSSHYLAVESGEVLYIDEEISSTVNHIADELEDAFEEGVDWTDEMIRATDAFQLLPIEMQPSALAAMRIEYDDYDSNQFVEVPRFSPRDSHEWMRAFIDTIDDDGIRNRLNATSQRKLFRQLRDVLTGDRRLEQQWFEFEATRQREVMLAWLHSIGIEPANPDVLSYNPPPLPDLRNIMFAEVRRFVRFARDIEGIRRIALIGSLAEDKEYPKDIDLLVTVSDGCDLAPLAELARQLCGHMTSHRAGADVFLASEDGEYVGRTCPWRDCGPGFRASCDALHCGLRPFLHDDLKTIRLKNDVITHPPVLLWPNPAANRDVAADVHEQLIKQLAEDEVR